MIAFTCLPTVIRNGIVLFIMPGRKAEKIKGGLPLNDFSKKYYRVAIIVFLVLIGLYYRFKILVTNGLLGDERYQYFCNDGPFKKFWLHQMYGDHSSFPGEYLLTFPLMRIFGQNPYGLAIHKILMTILGFYLLYRLCERYFQTTAGFVVAFLVVAFNRTLIQHAFEFRPYGILPVLALASLYFSDLLFRDYERLSRFKKIMIGLFFFAAMNYHAYGIIMAGLPLIFTGLMYRDASWKEYLSKGCIKYSVLVMMISLPVWAWYASANHFGMSPLIEMQAIEDPFQYIPHPFNDGVAFARNIVGNLLGCKILYPLLTGMISFFLFANKDRGRQLLFSLLLIILPLQLILMVDLKSSYWFLQRQFVWVMPLFAFLLGWPWDSLVVYFLANSFSKSSAKTIK